MKNYIAPSIDIHPADANILSDSTNTLTIFQGDKYDLVEEPTIGPGDEILIKRHNLWDEEE